MSVPASTRPKRQSMTLQRKMEIIKMKDDGMRNAAIARVFGLNESSVRSVLKNAESLRKMSKSYGASPFDSRKYLCSSSDLLVKMERFLMVWLTRKESEGVPVDKRQLKDQALCFYNLLCTKANLAPTGFVASNGWLARFLKRKEIRNVKLTGERCSADEVAAKEFPAILKGIIEEGGYHPDQVYNMDEAGLQYKRMPTSTYLSKAAKQARGHKADKLRFTLLFCVNATGTHKVKPLVVHTARQPHCYSHLSSMADANVYWRNSPSAWVNSTIASDWLTNCFVPEARRRCRLDKRPFKVILTLDNCSAHPPFLEDLHPKVRVVFLPPNTTSLLQPLDQEIIACVKAKYHKRVFRDLREKTESRTAIENIVADLDRDMDDEDIDDPLPLEEEDPAEELERDHLTVKEYWQGFTVKDAVDNVVAAWDEINVSTVIHAWRKLTPHLIPEDPPDPDMPIQVAADDVDAAVREARVIPGFQEVTADEIVAIHREGEATPSSEDIMKAAAIEDDLQNQPREEAQGVVEEDEENTDLSMGELSTILAAVESLKGVVRENEKCKVRATEVFHCLSKAFRFYHDELQKKQWDRKQSLITKFLSRPSPSSPESEPEPEPVPGPSVEEQPTSPGSLFTDEDREEFEGFLEEVSRMTEGTSSEAAPAGAEPQ